jgi:hypothetical protein
METCYSRALPTILRRSALVLKNCGVNALRSSLYWSKIGVAYQIAYPSDSLRAYALTDCGRMNPRFNRFQTSDRAMCYEGHRLPQ